MGNISSGHFALPGNPLLVSGAPSTLQSIVDGFNPVTTQASIRNRLSQANTLQPQINQLQLSLGTLPLNSRMISGLGSNPSLTPQFGGSTGLHMPQDTVSSLTSLSPLDAARMQLLRRSYGSTSGISASQLAVTRELAGMSSVGLPPPTRPLLSNLGVAHSLRSQSLPSLALGQQMLSQNTLLSRRSSSAPIEDPVVRAMPVARPEQPPRKRKRSPKKDHDDSKDQAS